MSRYYIKVLAKICLSVAALTPYLSNAYADEASDYQIKSAFLFNFLKLTEIPSAIKRGTIIICIAGNAEETLPFESIHGKEIGNLRVEVRASQSTSDVEDCDALFVANSAALRIKSIIEQYSRAGVMTVGEDEGFLDSGGMIRFFHEDSRVRFEVNSKLVASAGLHMSSKVLSLARIYER